MFWIDKYEHIIDQPFGERVLSPPVNDNIAVRTLAIAEPVDRYAPVIDDVTVTWVATDFAGNTNSCEIVIRVKRKERTESVR